MTYTDHAVLNETTIKNFGSKSIKTITAYLYVGDNAWEPQVHVTIDCSYYDVDDLNDASDANIVMSRSYFESRDFETYDDYLDSSLCI